MASIEFSHVALSCKDPLRLERFYARHFGFRRARVIPLGDEQVVMVKNGNVYLEIFRAKGEAPDLPKNGDGPEFPGVRHLAFKVDDIDSKLAEMGTEAVVTLGPLDFGDFIPGWRTVWLADPEGNIVEISQGYVDQEAPPPLEPEQQEENSARPLFQFSSGS